MVMEGGENNPAHCVIRLVIPTQKAGYIIGKGGANVKQIAEETTARIKIFECPDGYSERVVGTARSNALASFSLVLATQLFCQPYGTSLTSLDPYC